jgi:hypothetical protein
LANIVQYGKEAVERLATATRSGMLSAADFVKLAAFRLRTDGRGILLPPDYVSSVGAIGTNGSAHLRAQSSHVFVETPVNVNLADNLYYDGANWQRYNTGLPGQVLVMDNSSYHLYTTPSGANPAALTEIASFSATEWALLMNPPRSHVYGNGTTQAVNSGAVTPILFNTTVTNSAGAGPSVPWNAGTPGRLTAPVTGQYEFGGSLLFSNTGGGVVRMALLQLNGVILKGGSAGPPSGVNFVRVHAQSVRVLNAGDYVELCAYQDSGVAINAIGNSEESHFHLRYLGRS